MIFRDAYLSDKAMKKKERRTSWSCANQISDLLNTQAKALKQVV